MAFKFPKKFNPYIEAILNQSADLNHIKDLGRYVKTNYSKDLGSTSPTNFAPYYLFAEYEPKKDVFLVGNIDSQAISKKLYNTSKGKGVFKKDTISVGICFVLNKKLHILQDANSHGKKNIALNALRRYIKLQPELKGVIWLQKADFERLASAGNNTQDAPTTEKSTNTSQPTTDNGEPTPIMLDSYQNYTSYINDRLAVLVNAIEDDYEWYATTFKEHHKKGKLTSEDLDKGKELRAEILSFLVLYSSSSPDSQRAYKKTRGEYTEFMKDWNKVLSSAEKQARKNNLSKDEQLNIHKILKNMNKLRAEIKDLNREINLNDFA